MFHNLSFEIRAVYKKIKKKLYSLQDTDDNMVHAHCMLDT
jgi:hypothetical protein